MSVKSPGPVTLQLGKLGKYTHTHTHTHTPI